MTIPTPRRARPIGARLAAVAMAALAMGTIAAPAGAQVRGATGAIVDRASLEAQADSLDRLAAKADGDRRERLERQRDRVRERLGTGDFRVGDRIVLYVRGDTAIADTFTVREGQVLRLPGMEDIPLRGVLRSELRGHLAQQLSRFIRDPDFRATPLVRIGVLGQVGKPGYYSFEADVPVSDVIMAAGGPSQNADLGSTKIVRGDRTLLEDEAARDAIAQGRTIDQLDLRGGDQIVIEERRRRDWVTYLQAAAVVAGLAVSLIALQQ